MEKKIELLNSDFVAEHSVEDWGKNKDGWWGKLLEVDGCLVVATLPPNGKLWRAEMPVAQ